MGLCDFWRLVCLKSADFVAWLVTQGRARAVVQARRLSAAEFLLPVEG